MSYYHLGPDGNGDDDDDTYRQNRYDRSRRSHQQMPMPEHFAMDADPEQAYGERRRFADTRDRLAAQPTYSIENLGYSHGHSEAYESLNRDDRFVPPYASISPPIRDHGSAAYNDSDETPMLQPDKDDKDDEDDNSQHSHPTAWAEYQEFSFSGFEGNLVLDCPVPRKLYDNLSPAQQELREFTHMRYSAATCDPKKFISERFTLRQNLYPQPRAVELFIVVTMYNEEEDLLARTLMGIIKNVNYMEKLNCNDGVWGEGSWRNVVVCIVSDGKEKINPRSRALLAALGVYQHGISKAKVNDKTTVADIYEYTSQMEPVLAGNQVTVRKGNTPVQMIFCLKVENKQKINSHRWFFEAFSECIVPKYCVLIDAGTMPGNNSIYLLWRAFHKNKHCAGACGEIKAMLGKGGRNLLNPLVATQNFEYKMSNILDKPLESAFGFISVLPGAFSAYRWEALQGQPMQKYFAGEEMHNNSNFFTANMYLAEDRILCYELVAKEGCSWVLQYVKNSTGETDVPTDVADFISQRRRWLNGSFFAAVYTVAHFYKIWSSGHSFFRKIMLNIEVLYQIISMLFAWFALANFFLVFRILTHSLSDPDLLGKAGLILSVLFEWSYLVSLIGCFILALGNTPKGTRRVYFGMTVYWAIVMVYLFFASIFVTVKSVQSEVKKGFHWQDLFQDSIFSTLIVSMLSTYVLWFLVSFLFFDPWHMFTSFIQYLLMTPSYINILNVFAFCNTHDLSWGTKGDTSAPGGPGVKKDKDGKFSIKVMHPDAQYDKELALLDTEAPADVKTVSEKDKKLFYYASVRSGIVMGWIFTNLALCTVVLESGGVSVFVNSKVPEEQAQAENAKIYLSVVLWSVAGLSAFRFMGAMWFLIHRLFAQV